MIDDKKLDELKILTGIDVSKQIQEQLRTFVQLFGVYNSHTNLVSKNDEKFLYEKHIYDSLALSLFLQKYKITTSAKLLDIGTGGGFPSIPLSIFYPDMQIYPLDSIAKKIGFIELVQKELRLDNITTICKRVEELPNSQKASFDVVTSRAVASLNTLLEYTIPFVKVGSYFVAYKSKIADIELEQAQNALIVLNCKLVDRIRYSLPIDEDFSRELLIFQKQKETPILYPRNSGLAKKKPL